MAERDWDSKRNPLSGANNRCDDGSLRGGDVIIPPDVPFLAECKLRASFAHHALYADAKKDAQKHGKEHAVLYTKKKHQEGWLVTVDGELFTEMIRLYRSSKKNT